MKLTVKPTVRVRKMTFKSGSFDPRTGVLHIETHSGSSANVRTGVLGGSDNLMWQYEKKDDLHWVPFSVTFLLFLAIIGAWIYKYQRTITNASPSAISKQELCFVSGFALSLYRKRSSFLRFWL